MRASRVLGDRLSPTTYQCQRCGRIAAANTGRDKPATCRACAAAADVEATLPDTAWAVDALCAQVGADVWFTGLGGQAKAKAVCAGCPVTAECAAFAIATNQEFGVWGGLSAHERRHLTGGAA